MPSNDDPFMEHPTGDFPDAVAAMASAIERLRLLPVWDRWIQFCGQGQGPRPDSYHFANVRVRRDEIDVGKAGIDLDSVLEEADLEPDEIDVQAGPAGVLRVTRASPEQLARFLDGLFRAELGVCPFDDSEDDDYAVGAEWC